MAGCVVGRRGIGDLQRRVWCGLVNRLSNAAVARLEDARGRIAGGNCLPRRVQRTSREGCLPIIIERRRSSQDGAAASRTSVECNISRRRSAGGCETVAVNVTESP